MTHKQLVKFLEEQGACSPALRWIRKYKFDLDSAWEVCKRSRGISREVRLGWVGWWLTKVKGNTCHCSSCFPEPFDRFPRAPLPRGYRRVKKATG